MPPVKPLGMALALLLLTAACGSDPSGSAGGHQHEAEESHAPAAGFGTAADAGDADRTVQVEAVDQLKFDPAALQVEAGETVTFEVNNAGSIDHEFVLGDAAYQKSHGASMGEMEHADGNGIFLEPGTSDSLTWTFDEPGEVLFACHLNGHFEAGMVGRIEVR